MNDPVLRQHRDHPRHFEQFRYAYPVLSRRSRGLSLGVNLNPDKVCNFDCIYCQVDRREQSETRFVDMPRLLDEIGRLIRWITSEEIFWDQRFADVPLPLRRLNDIAFSGDGEPTTFRNFDEIIERVADLKQRNQLHDTRLVLITNASMFHRSVVQTGLSILDRNQGQIWAKLDAGTESYFRLIDRTPIPFQQILDNILQAARVRPLVIQSLFMRVENEPPSVGEIEAYVDRLREVLAGQGQIEYVQIYTVARRPAESTVTALTNSEVDRIAQTVHDQTGLRVESYYGR